MTSAPATGVASLCGPSEVPVNADDDNGSTVTTGIPTQRDFILAGPTSFLDQDIKQYTVSTSGLPAGGTWQMTLTQNGKGQVKLWKDSMKNAFSIPIGVTTFNFN